MRRWTLVIFAVATMAWSAPARSEPTPMPAPPRAEEAPLGDLTAAQVEAIISDVGVWSLDYNDILTSATSVMDSVDRFVEILDRFDRRELRERAALAALDEWRVDAVQRAEAVRARARTLRMPPSLRALGPVGERMEAAFITGRNDLEPLISEIITNLDAMAAIGRDAISDPGKGVEARQRVFFTSALELVRIDSRRIQAAVAALPEDHPNRSIMRGNLRYYEALAAFPAHELRVLDGGAPDPASVANTLERSAQAMRQELAQSEELIERMLTQARFSPSPPDGANVVRGVISIIETLPETVRLYRGVADSLDQAAMRIRAGATVIDAWASQEGTSLPILEQIARADTERARLAAEIRSAQGL